MAEWFRSAFAAPTPAQAQGWASIAAGNHTLIHAPTGSGKTLAAFLWTLDRLGREARPKTPTVRVLYVSPLKALIYDVERNLRTPLAGIRLAAERLGEPMQPIEVGVRTGDTPADERRRLVRNPPDILITTPESLYLILTGQASEMLRGVEYVIVDEVHAVAGTKRGAHLALSLERLEKLASKPPQRIGLSATQRPVETIARFLGGAGPGRVGESREVRIVDAGSRKTLELSVRVPVVEMDRPGGSLGLGELPSPEGQTAVAGGPEARHSIWPAIHPQILQLIREHHSTIIFCNSRRLAERLANKLNELAGEELVRAHHGSIAREQRVGIEEALKAGRLPAIVATSSLELGIDMGAVDLVIQVESPASVASGLQRVGRAGHQVGEPSRGIFFPKYRGDLLETAVVTGRMHEGAIEETKLPRNPLDVLAQQIVAATVRDAWDVDELFDSIRRAAPYESLTREAFEAVLGMLAGAYPSDEFAELKARVVWDRETGRIEGRRDARTVAITSGGTIPDRGLYPVFLVGEAGTSGRRVGELDEEMVYESRVGEVIALGATSWQIQEIRPDRVVVSPAPGVPGKIPFWHGDGLGRPIELGRALGAFVRELEVDMAAGVRGREKARRRLLENHDLDELAADNVLAYLTDELEAAGSLPTDRRIVIERFRDELGDWRIVILTPFGGRVHAPWALAIESRLAERVGGDAQTIWSDDGIAIRLPEGEVAGGWSGGANAGAPAGGGDGSGRVAGDDPAGAMVRDLLLPTAEEVEDLVVGRLGSSAMFAARFRENAARALLLPRRRPGSRTPLWMQRQRSAGLLAVASRYGSFPIIVETYRECLADLFDLPALREVLEGVARREIEVRDVETATASPFAGSLLFDYLAAYMYEGDAPLAERRAGALALDRELLRELLGQEELRDLIDPEALADLELALQALVPERAARSADSLHDLLRRLGDLSVEEVAGRIAEPAAAGEWLAALGGSRRAVALRIAGGERWIAIEDAARYRDAFGVALPVGVPTAFLAPVTDALGGLVARWARSHGPFHAAEAARRWATPVARMEAALEKMLESGTILRGEFRPGGSEREWCDPDVLRQLRRRSLARLRREVEPTEQWRWPGSCRSGRASVPSGMGRQRCREASPRWRGWPKWSISWPDRPFPLRCWSATYCLRASPAISPGSWTSSARWARSRGRATVRSAATTAGSCSSVRATSHSGTSSGATAPRPTASCTAASGRVWPIAAPRSTASCGPPPARPRNARFSMRCGTSSGPARSPTTRSLRCGPCAGDGPPASGGPVRAGCRWARPRPRGAGPGPRTGQCRAGHSPRSRRSPPSRRSQRRRGSSRCRRRTAIGHGSPPLSGARPAGPVRRADPRGRGLRRRGGRFPVPSTRSSGRWRRRAGSVAAISWRGWVPLSLRSPGPWTGSAPCASRMRAAPAQPVVHLLAAADPASAYGAALAWPRRSEADRRPLQRAAGAYLVLVDGAETIYLSAAATPCRLCPRRTIPPWRPPPWRR